jgi:hypothetical protein
LINAVFFFKLESNDPANLNTSTSQNPAEMEWRTSLTVPYSSVEGAELAFTVSSCSFVCGFSYDENVTLPLSAQ